MALSSFSAVLSSFVKADLVEARPVEAHLQVGLPTTVHHGCHTSAAVS